MSHIPVLLKESVDILQIRDGDDIVDATFGGGGHSTEILNRSEHCSVFAIDRDPEAVDRASILKQRFGERFEFVSGMFSKLPEIVHKKYDAILFDFGVSSFQLDEPSRGFSFSLEGPLDMRMSKDNGITACEVINSFGESDLAEIILKYGDERRAKKISKAITGARKHKKIETTTELKNIIHSVIKRKPDSRIDPATKTFQAVRIFVNDELREINDALSGITKILNDGARISTISFHSLEDRIIKNWAKSEHSIIPINRNPIKPSTEEIRKNPRSRSAILRGFMFSREKTGEK